MKLQKRSLYFWHQQKRFFSDAQFAEFLQRQSPLQSSESEWKLSQNNIPWLDEAVKIEHELLQLEQDFQARFVSPECPTFYSQFYNLKPICWGYWVKGESPCQVSLKIAVVGSRKISDQSVAWIHLHLRRVLQQTQVITVSGAATGVDQEVHRLSLSLGQKTMAILPQGFAANAAPEFKKIEQQILNNRGCLISEYHPRSGVWLKNYSDRNRLIAALGDLTLIVQGRVKSGTLLTAKHALELDRPIAVVPGHPIDCEFSGNLELLFSGAHFARDAADILMLLNQNCQTNVYPYLGPHS